MSQMSEPTVEQQNDIYDVMSKLDSFEMSQEDIQDLTKSENNIYNNNQGNTQTNCKNQ